VSSLKEEGEKNTKPPLKTLGGEFSKTVATIGHGAVDERKGDKVCPMNESRKDSIDTFN